MDALLLVGILLLNVVISVWNCYAVGTAWKDTMALGGGFQKLLLWCGVIQSGVGFSMPILIALTYGSLPFLTGGTEPKLTPVEAAEVMRAIFSLWYVAIIFPVLGSGLAITAHSIRIAYQRRDFASIAGAGWNTFAQVHNTISAVNNLGGALGDVKGLFEGLGGDGDMREKVTAFVFILVILALALGFMITFGLIRYFANHSQSRIEEAYEARA